MAANGPVNAQHGTSVVTFTTSSSQSSKSKSGDGRPTGRGGGGNIRQHNRPLVGALEEDKVTSPSGREINTRAGSQALTGRGGIGNVETITSKQRLEEARAVLQKEKAILAQHQQEMRRHEKQAVGRGGAGNFQRKKNTTVPKEFGFTGTQVGSKLFRTMTRSSRSSSERGVIDISRTDRDSDLWSIADSTMSRASTPGIIISKFGESLLGKRQQQPIANANAPACTVTGTVTGVCYSDASPSPNPKSYYDVTSPYSTRRTPNEVAPFEEPVEPSPIAAAVFNAVASSSSGRQARPSRPALTRLVGSWSTDEYPPVPKSATSSTFSYPYTYDDTASFDSHRSRRSIARSTTPIMDFYRQSGLSAPLRPPPPWIHSTSSSITNDCPLPTVSTSASAALRMVARSPQDSDRFSDRTGMRSSGSSFYAGQYSGTSTDTESRNDYSVSKTPFPRFINPSHRASTGQYGTPHSPALSSPSRFSITTTHSASSVPQLESFTPTFGMKKLPSLPAASIHSFDERSLPSPPSTPLPGSLYSEDAYDSDGVTIPGLHTRQPC